MPPTQGEIVGAIMVRAKGPHRANISVWALRQCLSVLLDVLDSGRGVRQILSFRSRKTLKLSTQNIDYWGYALGMDHIEITIKDKG